jgi:NAD(P)H-nitrite reductase large subunit
LLQAVVVGPGLLSARAFGGLLQQDLSVSIVQLGGGEFDILV